MLLACGSKSLSSPGSCTTGVPAGWSSLHQAHACSSRSSPSGQVQILSTHGRAHAQAAEDAAQLVGGSLGHGLLTVLLLLHGVLLLLEGGCHQGRGDAASKAVGVLEGWVAAAQRQLGRATLGLWISELAVHRNLWWPLLPTETYVSVGGSSCVLRMMMCTERKC